MWKKHTKAGLLFIVLFGLERYSEMIFEKKPPEIWLVVSLGGAVGFFIIYFPEIRRWLSSRKNHPVSLPSEGVEVEPAVLDTGRDVVQKVLNSSSFEQAQAVFDAYMERRYRPDEKDAVAAFIVRTMLQLDTGDLSDEVHRVVKGMNLDMEKEHQYFIDVLDRAAKIIEEGQSEIAANNE